MRSTSRRVTSEEKKIIKDENKKVAFLLKEVTGNTKQNY